MHVGYNPYNILYMFNTYCKQIADYDKMLPFKVFGTMFTGKVNIKGLAKGNNLENLIKELCLAKNIFDISDITKNLAIPTVDLNTGEIIYYLSKKINLNEALEINTREFDDIPSYKFRGNIASIVRASCSFPGVFEPKIYDGNVLIDGGVRVNTPVSILRAIGAKKVLAITFSKNDNYKTYSSNIASILLRSFDIMGHQVNIDEIKKADYILEICTDNISLLDGSKTNILANQGYEITKKNIAEIKKVLIR